MFRPQFAFLISLALIIILSLTVYFFAFGRPQALFWDENYHLAAAEKYIAGVMFMEPHPPLGKLLIALGEILFGSNAKLDKSSFLTTDFITSVPEGYTFYGVRFFPTLLAALAVVLFFLILYLIFQDWKLALPWTFLYLCDNALVVHCRGAMLEGIQLFFILSAVLVFLWGFRQKERKALFYLVLGALIACACAVKINSAILLLMLPCLIFEDLTTWGIKIELVKKFPFFIVKNKSGLPFKAREFLLSLLLLWGRVVGFLFALIICFLIPFYIHFALGKRVVEDKYYLASDEYRKALAENKTTWLQYFPVMLRDYFAYIDNYEKGVPHWDPTKPGENGSPPWAWPFGYKSINYRWDRSGDVAAYVYLQGNPLAWTIGLLGVVLAVVYLVAVFIFKAELQGPDNFRLILYFFIFYVCYMAVMLQIKRVMYLYHYFIPLIFSFILAALIFQRLFQKDLANVRPKALILACLLAVAVVAVFIFFAPFTYHIPLSSYDFKLRIWTEIWGLIPVTD